MRKSIFVIAALLAATFADAQITLEHTFDGQVWSRTNYFEDLYGGVIDASYFYSFDNQQLKLYDKNTYELYKTYSYTIPAVHYPMVVISYVTKNIFTTDGKTAFIFCFDEEDGDSQDYYRIIDEDGNIIYDFNNTKLDAYYFTLVRINGQYKLFARESSKSGKTYIYSLPGNGETADVSEVSAPHHNARKYLYNDQVLIDSNERTYNIQGKEVK